MLKFRVIPLVLVHGPNIVKGTEFNNWRRIGTLAPALKVHHWRDVDELVLLDTRASRSHTEFDPPILERALRLISVPLTVGGGIATVDAVARLIEGGADKVVIGSALSPHPRLLEQAANRFGSQALVAAIDFRTASDGTCSCYAHGGEELISDSPVRLARDYESAGAGELLVNSITRDGSQSGFDLQVTAEVSSAVGIPVIAAGGAGSPQDFVDLARSTEVSAGAAGSLFAFTETTPSDVREALAAHDIPVRHVR